MAVVLIFITIAALIISFVQTKLAVWHSTLEMQATDKANKVTEALLNQILILCHHSVNTIDCPFL